MARLGAEGTHRDLLHSHFEYSLNKAISIRSLLSSMTVNKAMVSVNDLLSGNTRKVMFLTESTSISSSLNNMPAFIASITARALALNVLLQILFNFPLYHDIKFAQPVSSINKII